MDNLALIAISAKTFFVLSLHLDWKKRLISKVSPMASSSQVR